MLVAIAAENDDYDVTVYQALLRLVLGPEVEAWRGHDMRFGGVGSVIKLGRPFLQRASAHGIVHALLAIDNDGGLRRHPEHSADHSPLLQAADSDGCRWCRLAQEVPAGWNVGANKHCIAVPVQTIETWLLVARGDEFANPVPEMNFARAVLKKKLLGQGVKPPSAERVRIGLGALTLEGAIGRLRQRPSFQLLEAQLADWRP